MPRSPAEISRVLVCQAKIQRERAKALPRVMYPIRETGLPPLASSGMTASATPRRDQEYDSHCLAGECRVTPVNGPGDSVNIHCDWDGTPAGWPAPKRAATMAVATRSRMKTDIPAGESHI